VGFNPEQVKIFHIFFPIPSNPHAIGITEQALREELKVRNGSRAAGHRPARAHVARALAQAPRCAAAGARTVRLPDGAWWRRGGVLAGGGVRTGCPLDVEGSGVQVENGGLRSCMDK
jgi:hypothetical protein